MYDFGCVSWSFAIVATRISVAAASAQAHYNRTCDHTARQNPWPPYNLFFLFLSGFFLSGAFLFICSFFAFTCTFSFTRTFWCFYTCGRHDFNFIITVFFFGFLNNFFFVHLSCFINNSFFVFFSCFNNFIFLFGHSRLLCFLFTVII